MVKKPHQTGRLTVYCANGNPCGKSILKSQQVRANTAPRKTTVPRSTRGIVFPVEVYFSSMKEMSLSGMAIFVGIIGFTSVCPGLASINPLPPNLDS